MLATFTVTNPDDAIVNTPAAVGTLRQAICDANQDDDPDTIDFAPSLSGETITLTQGELAITESVTIDASMLPDGITIKSDDPSSTVGNGSRIFNISAGAADVVFDGLTLTGGDVFGSGGAISSAAANLIVRNSNIRDNTSVFSGGGIWAIGNLTIIHSTISGNDSFVGDQKGGGIYFSGTSALSGLKVRVDHMSRWR